MELRVLDSLHRPFHRPLWIVKWVCYFINQRNKSKQGYVLYKDITTDFYFFLIEQLHNKYPQDSDGVPSIESVEEVWLSFRILNFEEREKTLRDILSRKREKGLETKIYSTYKAATYYLNLAERKLHFIKDKDCVTFWQQSQLKNTVLKSGVPQSDRKIYLQQILQYDGHFFLSMCLLYKPVKKYELKMEDEIFKFMQRYYPIAANFEYTQLSHGNYYGVRRRWIELLRLVGEKGDLSRVLTNIIKENSIFEGIYHDVENNVKDYFSEIRKNAVLLKNKKRFVSIYQKIAKRIEDKSGFVNLYDISREMHMGYQRFQEFLTQFYQEERLRRNIFFVNVVSTIERRKRFYIGKSPVMKIKITKYYGI